QMVKLEGAGPKLEVIRFLAGRDIPVCAHLGLTPQSVLKLGGFKVQGREEQAAARLRADALAVQEAGASMLVLECVPTPLAQQITASLGIPTIGIGAGPHCDGQVLVLHDFLGLDSGHRRPRFVKDFLAEGGSVAGAVRAYAAAVRDGSSTDAAPAYAWASPLLPGSTMIEPITELDALRERVRGWKREGLRVGFVPTMGNLHAGHFSLVRLVRQHVDRVVSSVFVNPTQFGPNEDFTRYPRTPDADTAGLGDAGCDVLWLPTVESMYPFGVELAS